MSGSRRSVPRPEQGASSRTQSNVGRKGQHLGDVGLHHAHAGRGGRVSTVRRRRSTRRPRRSVATIRPRLSIAAAIAVVLPPGDAQASRMRSPGTAAVSSATSCDDSSWTEKQPVVGKRRQQRIAAANRQSVRGEARRFGRPTPCDAEDVGQLVARETQRVRAKRQRGGPLSNDAHASAASNPWRSSHLPTSHSGMRQRRGEVGQSPARPGKVADGRGGSGRCRARG